MPGRRAALLILIAGVVLGALPAHGELRLPAGFTARVHVTGDGFDAASRGSGGIPSSSTLAVDGDGTLYVSRTGRRYTGGEVEDVFPIYRIPPTGAKLTPATESRFFFGPPLPNPQVAAVRNGRELFVTTFDRDRRIGVVYRIADGEIELFAGGTPPPGASPTLRQPEGAAVDAQGQVYVADRDQGVVVRFDSRGRLLDRAYAKVTRPRLVAAGEGEVWVAGDGPAEAPWQRGPGEVWRIAGDGPPALLLQGPVASGIALAPRGPLFVADRQNGEVFVLDAAGRKTTFARFTDNDAPRALTFVPVTPATRRAGLAGDLLLVVIRNGAWPVNEIVRVTGPFEEFLRALAR
jgi:sugar lactone lactonase YvrE